MREYGAEAITMLVREALTYDHKPPLVANAVSIHIPEQQHLFNNKITSLTLL